MTGTNIQPAITPVVGKRHRMRNGEETGVVIEHPSGTGFAFMDEKRAWYYNGSYLAGHAHAFDIVAVIEDEAVKEVGTLAEIGARVGDVVKKGEHGSNTTVEAWMLGGEHMFQSSDYRIVSRAQSDTPDYMDGSWHNWTGGECPVPGDVRVEAEAPDGLKGIDLANEFLWTHDLGLGNITRFRVILNAQASNSPSGGEVGSSAPTVRQKVLDAAADAALRDRNASYGGPEESFGLIAAYWSAHLGWNIKPHDVAVMMNLLKLARLKSNPTHTDSWVDIAGYAACGAEVAFSEGKE